MKHKNWFWGIFFLLAAIFVIASQTGFFGQLGLFTIIATVLLVALIISSIANRNFFGIFIPLAFLYSIYEAPFNLTHISFWLLILAAVLTSIGFSFLFRGYPKKWHGSHVFSGDRISDNGDNIDGNHVYAKITFGESVKYLHSDCLKSGEFKVTFGDLKIYFDQAKLSPDGAEIYLECSFGDMILYIPRDWKVKTNIHQSFGDVENHNIFTQQYDGSPTLTLTGNVNFGDITINYI